MASTTATQPAQIQSKPVAKHSSTTSAVLPADKASACRNLAQMTHLGVRLNNRFQTTQPAHITQLATKRQESCFLFRPEANTD